MQKKKIKVLVVIELLPLILLKFYPAIVVFYYFWDNERLDDVLAMVKLNPITFSVFLVNEYDLFIPRLQQISDHQLMIISVQCLGGLFN